MAVVKLVDDRVSVPDDTVLYRRTSWDKIGGRRGEPGTAYTGITENFFTDAPAHEAARFGFDGLCMSVGVSLVLGASPERMLADFPEMGLVSVTAGALRSLCKCDGKECPQGIMLYPTAAEPWHAVVFDLSEDKRSRGACKAIMKLSQMVVPLIA